MFREPIHFRLENGKRYAHTSTGTYQIKMASLQCDDSRLPNCACSTINDAKRRSDCDDQVIVIAEHDLKEHIICILDKKTTHQCKLNLKIQPGEQVAFRTIGKIPVHLSGTVSENQTQISE